MPIVRLHGHGPVRLRLRSALETGSLPSTILLHGAAGAGKQRLAIWLARLLLCQGSAASRGAEGCGVCEGCRFMDTLTHPDFHWYFPRPTAKSPPSVEEIPSLFAAAVAERVKGGLLYAPPSGQEGILITTVQGIVQVAGRAPSMGQRKVFVIGDADRMVPQEGSEYAANAFLKVLEEPSPSTTLILTSSDPQALLPTIKSRLVSIRVAPVGADDMRAFLADPVVAAQRSDEAAAITKDRAALEQFISSGAPGRLLAADESRKAYEAARSFLTAAASPRASARIKAAFSMGASGARGSFSDFLEALEDLAHADTRRAVTEGVLSDAPRSVDAVMEIERAKGLAGGNVSPQLTAMRLAHVLSKAAA